MHDCARVHENSESFADDGDRPAEDNDREHGNEHRDLKDRFAVRALLARRRAARLDREPTTSLWEGAARVDIGGDGEGYTAA